VSDVHAEGCKLKWDKPEDDGGEPITGYQVEKMDEDTGRWVPVCTTRDPEADVGGLIPGHKYKFRVKAVNAEGETEPLENTKATEAKNPYTEPDKPSKPRIEDYDKNRVDLAWDAPANDGGAPITGYIVEKREKGGKKWIKAAKTTGPETNVRVDDLIEGAEYEFRVKAVNKAGPGAPSDPSVSVVTKPRNLYPKIEHLRDITVHAGQPIKLDAKIIGEPPPKTTFFVNDQELKSGDGVTVSHAPYSAKVNIPSAKREHTGAYKLTASNPSGTDEVEVRVTVLDKPTAPEGPLEGKLYRLMFSYLICSLIIFSHFPPLVSDVHAEGCKLAWKPPKDDGGMPLDGYVVEKMDEATGKWVPCAKTTQPEATITGLEPGKKYKFRVRATNPDGDSEPLETQESIVAKNPFDKAGRKFSAFSSFSYDSN